MSVPTHGERLDRLEQVVHVIAEEQLSLEKIVADLATHMRKGFDSLADHMRHTDEQMRRTDEQIRRTDDRFRNTDERIDKLVVAIGELIRRDRPDA
jgi:hypothetical protein